MRNEYRVAAIVLCLSAVMYGATINAESWLAQKYPIEFDVVVIDPNNLIHTYIYSLGPRYFANETPLKFSMIWVGKHRVYFKPKGNPVNFKDFVEQAQ